MLERRKDTLEKLVAANRMLVEQGVLDVFGHVSVRDANHPDVFWLSTAQPPSQVQTENLVAFNMRGDPLETVSAPLFSERFIHASILRARPDVNAVCHHHATSVMPFCITRTPLRAVSQTGAFMGLAVKLWDSEESFGATRLLVDSLEQADSLAASIGNDWIVLMRGHGATVAGRSLEDVVFKSVFSCRDADTLRSALQMGSPLPLSESEIAMIGQPAAPALERAWAHWSGIAPRDAGSENDIDRSTL